MSLYPSEESYRWLTDIEWLGKKCLDQKGRLIEQGDEVRCYHNGVAHGAWFVTKTGYPVVSLGRPGGKRSWWTASNCRILRKAGDDDNCDRWEMMAK